MMFLLSKNINAINRNTEKCNYMAMSHHQNTGHNHNIRIDNKSCENWAHFKYLEIRVTDHNDEIKGRLHLGNMC
jgi:hypothetical protein